MIAAELLDWLYRSILHKTRRSVVTTNYQNAEANAVHRNFNAAVRLVDGGSINVKAELGWIMNG